MYFSWNRMGGMASNRESGVRYGGVGSSFEEGDRMKYASLCVLLCVSSAVWAERRGQAYTPKELHEMSTLVFRGTVMGMETDAKYAVTFPTSAKVSAVLKGETDKKELVFRHKNPGKNVIFEAEFNKPKVGQEGTFYIVEEGGVLVLYGYIREREEKGEEQDK